ncbi:MAG: hypothetical protein HQK77_15760 [Desulfobacterales bacterium]|nr:hypothetical protein [Desulfobacterales bacterium]
MAKTETIDQQITTQNPDDKTKETNNETVLSPTESDDLEKLTDDLVDSGDLTDGLDDSTDSSDDSTDGFDDSTDSLKDLIDGSDDSKKQIDFKESAATVIDEPNESNKETTIEKYLNGRSILKTEKIELEKKLKELEEKNKELEETCKAQREEIEQLKAKLEAAQVKI